MKLMTKALSQTMPGLGVQDGKGFEAVVHAKYFSCYNGWTWYATEFDGRDLFFGYVVGAFPEFGYFSLSEFEDLNKSKGFPVIERDLYFTPRKLNELVNI